MKRIAVVFIVVVFLLFPGVTPPALAQGPTDTPTPTATSTPTMTPTATPLPDLLWVTTLEPSGRSGGILFVITVGQAGIVAESLTVCGLLIVLIFLVMRRRG